MKLMIYRLGSLGDTIVSLPALRLVQQAYPQTERWILTNFNVNSKAAPMAQVLDGTGLVHGYIEYPLGLRDPRALLRLRQEIRRLNPDVLVYLTEPRGRLKALRDAAFFRACGIPHLIGVPYSETHQHPLKLADDHYEYEGARLLRCIKTLGRIDLDAPAAFALCLSDQERRAAQSALAPLTGDQPLIAASIGAKVDVKDWGDANWSALFARIAVSHPGLALVMLGASDERVRSDTLLRHWQDEKLNLCGRLSVRESAAVLEQSDLFIGHDSGPMHLAAAVGTPCVAIFSSRNLPGAWYPHGQRNRVLYQPMPCQGCELDVCNEKKKACIHSIAVDGVLSAVMDVICQDDQRYGNQYGWQTYKAD